MVILGTDAHKRSHTIVAVDETGRQIDVITVAATLQGHLRAVQCRRSGRSVDGRS
jgi:hypothetical protein